MWVPSLGSALPVRWTVRRKCPASKLNLELRWTVQRYGVQGSNIFVFYAGRSGVKVRLKFFLRRTVRREGLIKFSSRQTFLRIDVRRVTVRRPNLIENYDGHAGPSGVPAGSYLGPQMGSYFIFGYQKKKQYHSKYLS